MTTEQLATTIISQAIESAPQVGLTKPLDVAIHIRVALKEAGLKIVRAPRPR